MRVPRGGTVRDNRHRLVGGVRRVILDLDVHHRGQPAEPLGTDAQAIDLVVQLEPQFLGAVAGATLLQIVNIDRFQQRFLGQDHRLFGSSADADAEHARRAPPGTHQRYLAQHPVDHRVGRVQHRELGLGFRAAALGGDVYLERVAGHDFVVDHTGGIIAGILARAVRVLENRGPQHVIGILISAPNPLVAHVADRQLRIPLHLHADAQEHGDDTGVLADWAMPQRAHARIDQDLRNRIARRRVFLALVGFVHGSNEVQRVIVGNVLQRVGDAFDQIVLLDNGHLGINQGFR